ncbi:hypothetical protein NDU88_006204 [Pleurodeles waltl]|uniref:Uncharacterized protein n=1 Tax=Pleurodeles waltl TaxID=8319 RepID=A0AAV7X0W3_PLEWA|nr:hypothetical protein NDU88_006204 [Pleurodeles waltl]
MTCGTRRCPLSLGAGTGRAVKNLGPSERLKGGQMKETEKAAWSVYATEGCYRTPKMPPRSHCQEGSQSASAAVGPGPPPHPVVAQLLHFKDRDVVLLKAHNNGPYALGKGKVLVFPDFTAKVQNQRASYQTVKKAIRDEELQNSLVFPAKLRIIQDGTTHFCNTPEEPWTWIEAYRMGASHPPPKTQTRESRRKSRRKTRGRPERSFLKKHSLS